MLGTTDRSIRRSGIDPGGGMGNAKNLRRILRSDGLDRSGVKTQNAKRETQNAERKTRRCPACIGHSATKVEYAERGGKIAHTCQFLPNVKIGKIVFGQFQSLLGSFQKKWSGFGQKWGDFGQF